LLKSIKKLSSHSIIYGLGNLGVAGVGVLFVPLYTNMMTLTEYSKLEILMTAVSTLSLIGPLGIGNAIIKMLENDCETVIDQRQLIGTSLLFIILISGLFALITGSFAHVIARRFLNGSQDIILIILALLTVNANIINAVGLSVLRARMQASYYAALSFSHFAVVVGCNLWFIIKLGLGVKGAMMGNMIGSMGVTCILLPIMIKQSHLLFSFRWLQRLLAFSLPIVPNPAGWSLLRMGERALLQVYTHAGEVGLFGLGYKFSQVFQVGFVSPFSLAWPPVYFSMLKEENGKEKYALIFTYLCFVGGWGVLAISLFAPLVIEIISPHEYLDAYHVVPLMTLAQFFQVIYYYVVASLHMMNKTVYTPFVNFIPAILGLLLDLWLVPYYGMYAAAASMCFAFMLRTVMTFRLASILFPVKYEWGRIIKIVLVGVGLYIVCTLIPVVSPLYFIFAVTGLISYPIMLYMIEFFSSLEIEYINGSIGNLSANIIRLLQGMVQK